MTNARRPLVRLAGVATATLLVASTQLPAHARTVDDRCAGAGPIPAGALTRGVSGLGCSLVGRVVVHRGMSVTVPPAGMSVGGEGVSRHGDVTGLRVSNTGTTVRAFTGPAASRGTAGAAKGSPPACKDRTFNLAGHRWVTSLRYHSNLSKAPARYHKKTLVKQIKAANNHMRKGTNTCGKPRLKTPVGHYLGATHARPDIRTSSSTVSCGRYNTTNVVAFGNLPGNLLGWTCYWWLGSGHLSAADIMMDTGQALTTHLPRHCVNRWDFEGALTHEFGHAYGLAHTGSGHANLTMQHELSPCSTYARTLGLGDWLGMRKMYGAR
jgi:hypothetical protein